MQGSFAEASALDVISCRYGTLGTSGDAEHAVVLSNATLRLTPRDSAYKLVLEPLAILEEGLTVCVSSSWMFHHFKSGQYPVHQKF